MRRARAVLFPLLLLPVACSPTAVLNALAPRDGVTVTRDIAYQDGPRHTLDVYAPHVAAAPAPVVVFFYGGGWESGSKEMYRFVGAAAGRARSDDGNRGLPGLPRGAVSRVHGRRGGGGGVDAR